MKPEDQIKSLAELDGLFYFPPDGSRTYGFWQDSKGQAFHERDYLTSYDAIIPLIQKQYDDTQGVMMSHINMMTKNWLMLDATPAQLCEALLRATGKWTE